MHPDDVTAGASRRKFLATLGTSAIGAVALSTGAITWLWTRDGNGVPRAYEFAHEPDIALWIGNGERFLIEVRRGTEVLERHENVTADGIADLDSRYFSARYIATPSAV